jgi:hypothetical protein
MPDGPGKEETIAICSPCHGAEMTSRRSDRAWDSIWSTMLGHGMPPQSPEMKLTVITYLKTYLSTQREPPPSPAATP